jgi:tetratricopeptide (TPR) repeat protein
LQTLRDLLEPDDARVAILLCDLAADQLALGKFYEARNNFQEAFQINKTANPKFLPLNLGNLALVCDREGNSKKALSLFKQAIDIMFRQLSLKSPGPKSKRLWKIASDNATSEKIF